MTRTRVLLIFAVAFVLLWIGTAANAQTAQSPLPKPTGYVNDYAGVVDDVAKQRLETTLANLDRQQQIQFAVVTIDTTGGQDIFDYSLAVARGWGIGAKDVTKASLLLLVAVKDRKYFTQVSRHLEGDLPDGLVGQIQREHLVPAFRAGQYGQGLVETIDTYIATLATKNGFSTDSIFPAGVTREPQRPARGQNGSWGVIIGVFFIAIIIIFVLRAAGGGGRGGSGGGWFSWFLLNALLNSGRGSRSSGWGGGGFGGFSGGSGGSSGGGGFGGFGGGGDFGGGGSGGSW